MSTRGLLIPDAMTMCHRTLLHIGQPTPQQAALSLYALIVKELTEWAVLTQPINQPPLSRQHGNAGGPCPETTRSSVACNARLFHLHSSHCMHGCSWSLSSSSGKPLTANARELKSSRPHHPKHGSYPVEKGGVTWSGCCARRVLWMCQRTGKSCWIGRVSRC